MMHLVFSPSAAEDLQSISTYTLQRWGEPQEERYLLGLWRLLEIIVSRPESFRKREEFAEGCRTAGYESHIIFFRIRGQNIEIMRILHGSMDFDRHLPD